MLPYGYTPLTYDEWKRIKSATRWRRYLERQAEAAEASADAWLAAVDRDDRTDPHERQARQREGAAQ